MTRSAGIDHVTVLYIPDLYVFCSVFLSLLSQQPSNVQSAIISISPLSFFNPWRSWCAPPSITFMYDRLTSIIPQPPCYSVIKKAAINNTGGGDSHCLLLRCEEMSK